MLSVAIKKAVVGLAMALAAAGLAACSFGGKPAPTPAPVVDSPHWSDVSAIFQSRCAQCHIGPKSGGLSLASYDDIMKGGKDGKVVVPGDHASSLLWLAINGKPNDANVPRMPLGQPPLPASAIQTITNWIDQGAPQ